MEPRKEYNISEVLEFIMEQQKWFDNMQIRHFKKPNQVWFHDYLLPWDYFLRYLG